MKKTTLFAALLCLLQSPLHAQSVASTMNYQGKVTDSSGTAIGTGTPVNRKIRFRIYDAASAGNLLWGELQTVTIANGEFSVLLGTGDVYTLNAITDSHGTLDTVINTNSSGSSPSNDRYMEITVDDGTGTIDASDTPISPRQQITTTAFAFRAKTAESVGANNSLQLGTASSSGLGFYNASRSFNSYTIDGPVLYGNSGGALGTYSGGSTQKATLLWNSAGQVGVGTPVLSTSNTNTTNKLVLQGDDANTPAQQMVIRGNTDTAEKLNIGFDTTANVATLQSYANSTVGNLLLNPSGGNVGIGTTTPGVPLAFASTTGEKIALWGQGAGGYGFGIQNSLLQIHSDTSTSDVAFGYGSSSSMTETMRIKGTGNVGIGTSNPSAKLDVNGNVSVAGGIYMADGAIYGKNSSNAAEAAFWPRNSNGTYLNYGTNGLFIRNNASTTNLYMTDAGNVGIGTTAPNAKLTVGAPLNGGAMGGTFTVNGGALGSAYGNELVLGNIGFTTGNTSSLTISAYRTAAGTTWNDTALILGMNVDNTWRPGGWLSLHANGYVGIGNVTPTAKLDVTGDIKASGDIKSNGKSVPVAEESNLRIVRGTVKWDCSVLKGSGYTVTRTGVGYYALTFTTPFSDAPTITCTSINNYYICSVTSPTASGFLPYWMNNSHVATDCDFNFIAIGPR